MGKARSAINISGKAEHSWMQAFALYLVGSEGSDLLRTPETITRDRYRLQLIRLSRALKEKRSEYSKRHDKVILLHENARPHVAKPNAILQRHAEEVVGATGRLRAETAAARERLSALQAHRRALVALLVPALQALVLPDSSFSSGLERERPPPLSAYRSITLNVITRKFQRQRGVGSGFYCAPAVSHQNSQ
ncbi:Mariner Mos1 transposase [Eumeta japonica]|uniref:Mariner Mos1 transposase n=1 Tax=Eumeta variegata TaxID=151549 RepID=A0A4C1X8B2_EUMVA|nr:Mariner Mos1 transposase [Eumeta japonica]